MAVVLFFTCDRSALSVTSQGADSTAASFNTQLLSRILSQTSEGLTLFLSPLVSLLTEWKQIIKHRYCAFEWEVKTRLSECGTLTITQANVVTWIWSCLYAPDPDSSRFLLAGERVRR